MQRYVSRCKLCDFTTTPAGIDLTKQRILDHLSQSHNIDVVDFASEITLSELSVWATTTRLNAEDAVMLGLLMADKRYFHFYRLRNQTVGSRQSPFV